MQVPHVEELATHNGPESCAGHREVAGEALTGGMRAGLLSRESTLVQGADGFPGTEGKIDQVAKARSGWTLRGQRTMARIQAPYAGIGRSYCWPGEDANLVRTANLQGERL